MICLDTTALIDQWRNAHDPAHPACKLLADHAGEIVAVPIAAAGEFLEGAAFLSGERLQQSLSFLAPYHLLSATLETALHFSRAAAHLRRASRLDGISKFDVWIAATALEHGAPLVTRNARHFRQIPGLNVIAYAA